ncbi:hypothetical protein SAMN04515659_1554 [Dyella sp. 333MFSha]|nr:hypothetical protein SAMN04515659_1554 [Dyella sp. 333MFSha]
MLRGVLRLVVAGSACAIAFVLPRRVVSRRWLGPLACLFRMASFALVGLRVREQGSLLPHGDRNGGIHGGL